MAKGKLASFIIYDANPLDTKALILESWLLGKRKIHNVAPGKSTLIGKYNLSFSGKKYPIEIKENGKKYSGKVTYSQTKKGVSVDTTVNLFVDYKNNDITLQFNIRNDDYNGSVSLRGKVISRMEYLKAKVFYQTENGLNGQEFEVKKEKPQRKKLRIYLLVIRLPKLGILI